LGAAIRGAKKERRSRALGNKRQGVSGMQIGGRAGGAHSLVEAPKGGRGAEEQNGFLSSARR